MNSESEAIIPPLPAGFIHPSEARTAQRLLLQILLDRLELVFNKYVFFPSSELEERVDSGVQCGGINYR